MLMYDDVGAAYGNDIGAAWGGVADSLTALSHPLAAPAPIDMAPGGGEIGGSWVYEPSEVGGDVAQGGFWSTINSLGSSAMDLAKLRQERKILAQQGGAQYLQQRQAGGGGPGRRDETSVKGYLWPVAITVVGAGMLFMMLRR